MDKLVFITIEKVNNGFILEIKHDIYGCEKIYYKESETLLERLKDMLEGLY